MENGFVIVSIVDNMLAVATNDQIAVEQLTDMVKSAADEVIADVKSRGDVRRRVSLRTVYVEVNNR